MGMRKKAILSPLRKIHQCKDEKIKRLIRENDPSALEIIYDQMGERLYKYILSILCSEMKAEEVMQNLFVAIAKKRHRLARASNLTGYIFAMARNQAVDFLRSQPVHEKNIEDYENIIALKGNMTDRRDDEELREVNHVLLSLPQKQKEVISMKIFQGMPFKDLAKALNISSNTVASRYRYGIEKLRNKLRRLRDEG